MWRKLGKNGIANKQKLPDLTKKVGRFLFIYVYKYMYKYMQIN